MFQKIEMQSRMVGFDNKFVYIEQSMWHANGDCANHILVRGAVVKNGKMVPPIDLIHSIDPTAEPAQLPDWVHAWAEADQTRPWPPERS